MTRYKLEISERFLRRTFEKGVARSLLKILAEPITNSDDSYRRLEAAGGTRSLASGFGALIILADRNKRRLVVTDYAEGLTEDDMRERFVEYGRESGDRERGYRTRSLFGKGLRDVLFTQKFGLVKSIKDGRSAIAEFGWRGSKGSHQEPTVDIDPGPRVTPELRRAWGIPGTGTRVEFQLRGDIPFPQHDTICQKLRNFYMLRVINSSPHRNMILQTVGKRGDAEETTIRLSPIPGELLIRKILTLKVDGLDLPVEMEISRAETDLTQVEAGMENRVGGLLVLDEDSNALDLTLFKFDMDPTLARMFGSLKIGGAGTYIREKINADPPEEVLTETREGFDRKHRFYKAVAALVEPFLEDILEEELERRKGSAGEFTRETREHLARAMGLLNKLYEDLVGRADLGNEYKGKDLFKPTVIEFIRSELLITEKVVTPVALLINASAVPQGTLVKLSSSDEITVLPSEFVVHHEKAKDDLSTKVVRLIGNHAGVSATVTAEAPQGKAVSHVKVVLETILYPTNGLEFAPANLSLVEGKARALHLYIDARKIETGSIIQLAVDNESFRLSQSELEFGEHHKVNNDVGRIEFLVSGRGVGSRGTIEARCVSFLAYASVRLLDKEKTKEQPERGRRFRDPVFEKISLGLPTVMRPDGTVVINMNDEVNKKYFGDDPHVSVSKQLHCQVRLADLVLDECLNEIVTTAWGKTLEVRFPDEPAVDIRMHVAQLKYKIGPAFHSAFVTIIGPISPDSASDRG